MIYIRRMGRGGPHRRVKTPESLSFPYAIGSNTKNVRENGTESGMGRKVGGARISSPGFRSGHPNGSAANPARFPRRSGERRGPRGLGSRVPGTEPPRDLPRSRAPKTEPITQPVFQVRGSP